MVWAGVAGLRREAIQTGDPKVLKLLAQAQAHLKDIPRPSHQGELDLPVVCPRFRIAGQTIRTISSVMRFDTAVEVTTSELKVELMFPADEASEAYFRKVELEK